jgi:ABC-type dipeptide/oligopeptide/nickel transport system permease subunit
MTATTTTATTSTPFERKPANLWRDAAMRFSKNNLAMIALVIVLTMIFMAIFADFIAPYGYDEIVKGKTRQFPNANYWFGTDNVGFDVFSRIVYGARVSLIIGLSVQVIAVLVGVTLGAIAGFVGGWADYVMWYWHSA